MTSNGSIHPDTALGAVSLTVTNLDRSLDFYQRVLGFRLHRREDGTAALGAGGTDLVLLHEDPAARRYRGTSGLYHFAILLPNRRELGRAILQLLKERYLNYPTDHIMTKSDYLDDPDGNGIELYCESPEDGEFVVANGSLITRRADGTLSNGREPLDLNALFTHLAPGDDENAALPPETRLGHVHLHVADLDEAMHFYHDVLGFDSQGLARAFRMGMVSAGGYHHHIGLNTWQGEGVPPAPPDAIGLRWYSVELPDTNELGRVAGRLQQAGYAVEERDEGLFVRDPFDIGIVLTTRPTE